MRIEHPFHQGELDVQERLGETDEARRNGRAIADSILPGAFKFVERQPFVVVGSVDGGGANWASLVFGTPGFTRATDERTLELDLQRALLHPQDPLTANLAADPRAGVLLIEPGSRRRLRINGSVTQDAQSLRVAVDESFPNCPKYIQRRELHTRVDFTDVRTSEVQRGCQLGADELALAVGGDTFFVASSNPRGGVDVSHRGGDPGFVQVDDEGRLVIPDYVGNHMYNTLGNFVLNPNAGLTFLDFERGQLLLTTGRVEILWEHPGAGADTGGTHRYWRYSVDRWLSFEVPIQLEWELLDLSPFNPS